MAVSIKKGNALASLSITPLIDVVFLLLIFFLVATRFAEEDRELDVLLPSAADAKPLVAKPKLLFVSIDDQGRYYYDGAVRSVDQLKEVLAREVVNNSLNQSVVLRADQRCDWGHVAAALDACHSAGIKVRPATSTARAPAASD
jgi:biopolymer transport protein ExbD